jgi:hypothetical protein
METKPQWHDPVILTEQQTRLLEYKIEQTFDQPYTVEIQSVEIGSWSQYTAYYIGEDQNNKVAKTRIHFNAMIHEEHIEDFEPVD